MHASIVAEESGFDAWSSALGRMSRSSTDSTRRSISDDTGLGKVDKNHRMTEGLANVFNRGLPMTMSDPI